MGQGSLPWLVDELVPPLSLLKAVLSRKSDLGSMAPNLFPFPYQHPFPNQT